MRNDETVYLMGEEVAEYNGAKASKGMCRVWRKRVIDTPIAAWIYWNCSRFSDERLYRLLNT
jgi:pyruvate/2-oxoglutarate/acetoin dehydrogenase E1 component